MLLAVRELEACGGGIVAVDGGRVLAKVELPVAGLMSLRSAEEVAVEMRALNQAVIDLGIDHRAKALATSGLALTVIPQVRVSDLLGLFDVQRQEGIPVFYEIGTRLAPVERCPEPVEG